MLIVGDLQRRLAIEMGQGHLEGADIAQLVQLQVALQPEEFPLTWLKGPYLACGPYPVGGEQREQAVIGPRVDESHSGGQEPIEKGKLVRFETTTDIDLLAEVVTQVYVQMQAVMPRRDEPNLWLPVLEVLPDLAAQPKRQTRIVPVRVKAPARIRNQRPGPGQLRGQTEDLALVKVAVEAVQRETTFSKAEGEAQANRRGAGQCGNLSGSQRLAELLTGQQLGL